MLPLIAVTDPTDAQLLFDVLNAATVTETDTERRERLMVLMIATYAEIVRMRDSHTENGETS